MPGRATRRSSLGLLVLALVASACAGDDPRGSPTVAATVRSTATPAVSAEPSRAPTQRPDASPSGGVYLALGDSVTFGIGAPRPRQNGYVGVLADRLESAEPPISETEVFAVPGETASGFLERRMDDVTDAIARHGERVRLVTIGLGANELLRIRRDPACRTDRTSVACTDAVAAATTRAAAALDGVLTGVQEALRAAGSDARVLVLAYYNPDVDPIAAASVVGADGAVSCDPGEPAPGLDDRIACIAQERQATLVNLYAAFAGREDELTGIGHGDVHPNAAGHRVIAETIAEALGLP